MCSVMRWGGVGTGGLRWRSGLGEGSWEEVVGSERLEHVLLDHCMKCSTCLA